MKHVIKVLVVMMFFGTTVTFAQSTEEAEKKVEKVEKTAKDKRVYDLDKKKHLATKKTAETKIASMDTNKDGKISVDEASAAENTWYSEHFAKIDTNSDGYIDVKEMKAKMAKKKNKKKDKAKLDY